MQNIYILSNKVLLLVSWSLYIVNSIVTPKETFWKAELFYNRTSAD